MIIMNEDKVRESLKKLQSEANILYDELGLTEEVLDLQTVINQFRHRYNIVDETKLTESNEGFVQ